MVQFSAVREFSELFFETDSIIGYTIYFSLLHKDTGSGEETVENETVVIFGIATTTLMYSLISTIVLVKSPRSNTAYSRSKV